MSDLHPTRIRRTKEQLRQSRKDDVATAFRSALDRTEKESKGYGKVIATVDFIDGGISNVAIVSQDTVVA